MSAPQSSIRDIVVIVDSAGDRRPVKVAAELARRTNALLTGLTLAFDPVVPVYSVAAPIPSDFIAGAHEQAVAEAKAASEAFVAMASTAGIAAGSRVVETISGDGFASLVRDSVLTDLAVVGQNDPDHPEPVREALIEALLFQSGLPTLLIPYSGTRDLVPDRVAIAWNGSTAAGRAVRAAMPMLAMAKEVLVVMVEEGRKPSGDPGADVAAYLGRHGLNAIVRTVVNAPTGAGATLLDFAVDEEVGWLVMGAYGHSRLREFLLGGVTRHILANATLPVLLSH